MHNAPLTIVVLTTALGACAGLDVNRRSPGRLANGTFSPTLPEAPRFGIDVTRACPLVSAFRMLVDELDDFAKKEGKPAPQPDGRLCSAADTLLGWVDGDTPPDSVLQFVAGYFGLTAPDTRAIITTLESEDPRGIAARLFEGVSSFAVNAQRPRFGVVVQRQKKNATKIVLLMQDEVVHVDPVPRRFEANARVTLTGGLFPPFEAPTVLVSDPAGTLTTENVPTGDQFEAELRCGDQRGPLNVEIRGRHQDNEAVVARFQIMCGVDTRMSVAVPKVGSEPAAAEERKLLELINAERASIRLPALVWDEALAKVARGLSESLRDSGGAGNLTADDLTDRLKAADAVSPVILQNPVQARTVLDAHAATLTSPVHRSYLLSREVNVAGIGLAIDAVTNGSGSVYVTELFSRQLPVVDVADIRQKLAAAIAQRRVDARANPIASDPLLEETARTYVKELAAARGNLPKERADEIVAPMYKAFRTVNLMMAAKAEPLEFSEEPGIIGDGQVYGLGVAQGSHPTLGKNAAYVVLLIGTPQAPSARSKKTR